MQDATHAQLRDEPLAALEEMAAGRLGVTPVTRRRAQAELASRALTRPEGEPCAALRESAAAPRVDASSRAAAPTEAGASPSDTSHAARLMDATLRALEPEREPVSLAALRAAKAAYDRRST